MSPAPNYSALERSLAVLLSPLDHPSWQAWQKAVHPRLLELTDADSLCIYTPMSGAPDGWYAPHLAPGALDDYSVQLAQDASWDVVDVGFNSLAARTGRTVAMSRSSWTDANASAHHFIAIFSPHTG